MRSIVLHRTPSGWVARYRDDKEIIRLFGTDTLPTGFTADTPTNEVVEEIQRLNPNHKIYTVRNAVWEDMQ